MKRPGIHLRLLVAAFLLICASAFTLDVVGVHITRQFMVTRFRDRISFLAKYLALNSEVGVLIGDRSGLKSLALNLLGEEDVARVTILDNHDRQLVDLSRAITGPLSVVEAPVRFKKTRDEDLLFRSNQTPFGERQVPGVDYIGKVRITFSTHGIDELMVEITRQFILFSTGLAIIAGLVFYFISRSIVLEVTRLATTARQVGKGELTLRARPGSLPETRELAVAFNSMLDSLEWSSKALENAYQEMIQQNTLAEVGKFSTMIAHEVKNHVDGLGATDLAAIRSCRLSRANALDKHGRLDMGEPIRAIQ
ncbi:MAG: HAMP domain-containing protein, partial [Thermodesulfobacteriota bacterium]|nr:HAMP domain-containing protein [Thermodesulfobacteriota bacterium]